MPKMTQHSKSGRGGAPLTFQAKNPFPQRVHDVFERCLVGDVEEVLVIGVARYEFYLVQKGFGIDPSSVIITQYLGLGEEGVRRFHAMDKAAPKHPKSLCLVPRNGSSLGGCKDGCDSGAHPQHSPPPRIW